jgi:hypothetical protein
MTYRQIANQIPSNYRKEILETNLISSAIASASDPAMQYLGTIWKNYVNPMEKLDCGMCLERVLNNYRQLQPVMIEMEKERKLLGSV